MLAAHYRTMAAYNRWANRRLYDAAARLADAEYRADHKAFFGSLHGTLNHLLVADRIWMARILGRTEAPMALETILYERLSDLTVAREAEDERIANFVAALDGPALARSITYRNTKGAEFTNPLGALLAHLFNHETHHRGQAHAIFTGLGKEAPVLDLIAFLRMTP
jgi:uncharacterized damage-inducible protein DinB